MHLLIVALSIACVFCPCPTMADDHKPAKLSIAVSDLEAKAMDAETVSLLTDRFRAELFRTKAFTVMERGKMDEILGEQGFQASGACSDNSCLVAMGEMLGVRKIVAGSVGKLGNLYAISVRLIDIQSGEIERIVSEECECPVERLIYSFRSVAAKLAGSKAGASAPANAKKPRKLAPAPSPAPAAARKPEYRNRPGLQLHLFSSLIMNSDMNEYLQARDSVWEELVASVQGGTSEPAGGWHTVYGAGGRLKIAMGPAFGLRLGAGVMASGNSSGLEFNDPFSSYAARDDYSYTMVVLPLEADIVLELGTNVRASFSAGAGAYPMIFSYYYKSTWLDTTFYSEEYYEESAYLMDFAPGANATAGVELHVNPHFSLGASAGIRLLTFSDISGAVTAYSTDGSVSTLLDGEEVFLIKYRDINNNPAINIGTTGALLTNGVEKAEVALTGLVLGLSLNLYF